MQKQKTFDRQKKQVRSILFAVIGFSVPIVPFVATSAVSARFLGTPRIDMHGHPSLMHTPSEKFFVSNKTNKDVITFETQKVLEVDFLIGSDSKVVRKELPFPVKVFSTWWQSRPWKKLITEFFDGSRHSPCVYYEERESSLIVSTFQSRVSEENISTLDSSCYLLRTFQGKITDDSQGISEEGKREVRESHFAAKQKYGQVLFLVGLIGALICGFGVCVLCYSSIGWLIFLIGFGIMFYNASIMLD